MKSLKTLLFLLLIPLLSAGQENDMDRMEQTIDSIILALTIEEKASLCSGRDDWSTQAINRLGIPWIWLADGPHGLRRAPATNKPGYGDQLPATCFPTASALAASWDTDLIREAGRAIGKECQALKVNVLLGPGVNIKRSPLGGRNFEYYSEDPLLSGEMGAAFVAGVQSQGVGTSLKHFAANNVETHRMYVDSKVDLRSLHEIYLMPFEIVVRKASPWTIMACYNRVRGEYGTQNAYLLGDILRNTWGYKGTVISDWFAVIDKVEAIRAGLNLEMPKVSELNDRLLVEAVKNGTLDEALLDARIKDILRLVLRAKLLEKPDAVFDFDTHHHLARKIASETITLLKNEGNILPLTTGKYKKVALIGAFATAPRYQGNGSSEVKPTRLDNILDVLQQEYGKEYTFTYAQGYDLEKDEDFSLISEAAKMAGEADIALIFAGLPLSYESEGIDRTHIDLPAAHNQLIREISAIQRNTAVILSNGSAVAMPWIEQTGAVLEAWLGGQAGAGATADVLFGKVNPSGKLAETFPLKLEDTPAFLNFPGEQGEVLYGERIFVGYRYFEKKNQSVLFPFGHGLSYTQFEYSGMELSSGSITTEDTLEIIVNIRNTGGMAGKEVVQLYVTDKESSLSRPVKELKGFRKIELDSGQDKTVRFTLSLRDFAFYDIKRADWVVESGEFVIQAGSSSQDIRLSEEVHIQSLQQIPLGFDEYTYFSEFWKHKQTRDLLIEYLPGWIRDYIGADFEQDISAFPPFMVEHPLIKYPYITGGQITHAQVKELIEKARHLTYQP